MSAATVAAIAKAAVAVLSNEKTRKALGWVIVAILSPLIVLVVLICAVLSGSSQHNVSAVELCFHGGTISSSATPEYRGYIEDMRGSFAQLDRAIEEINAQCEDGNSLDDTRVKAVFYALYFAAEHPDDSGIRAFTDCFVDYEERTRTVTTTDEEGNEVEVEETYTVAIPVTDMNEVYARIEAAMGITVTPENQSNADSIYNIVLYGTATGTGDWFPGADVPFISVLSNERWMISLELDCFEKILVGEKMAATLLTCTRLPKCVTEKSNAKKQTLPARGRVCFLGEPRIGS